MRKPPLLIIALLLAGVVTAIARADKASQSTTGRVIKVDGTNVIVGLGDREREVIVPTDDKTQIRVDGEPAKLADLKSDMTARITQVDGLTTLIEAKTATAKKK